MFLVKPFPLQTSAQLPPFFSKNMFTPLPERDGNHFCGAKLDDVYLFPIANSTLFCAFLPQFDNSFPSSHTYCLHIKLEYFISCMLAYLAHCLLHIGRSSLQLSHCLPLAPINSRVLFIMIAA